MAARLVVVFLCFSFFALAAEPKLKLKMWQGDKEVSVLIQEVKVATGAYLVNEICAADPKSCAALKVLSAKPPKKIPHPKGLAGHPASQLCEALGGNDVILSDEKKEQYNYCAFKDDTLIDSWQVHSHHFRKEGAK